MPGNLVTNRLLDRLPAARRARVIASCENVDLVAGEHLAQAGEEIDSVYFPTGSSISLLVPLDAISLPEVALAGSEGFLGMAVALGMTSSATHARVQCQGPAWRMPSAAFTRELSDGTALRDCVDRYILVSMSQLARHTACGRFHAVLQRVARRLLMSADRAHSSTFRITHEALALGLGVRRVSVTGAARLLGKRGLIRYSRGEVTIVDRAGLARAACSCYREDNRDYRRYLS